MKDVKNGKDPIEWAQRWEEGTTGWDEGTSAPGLDEFVAASGRRYERAFAPGCGAGYDLEALNQIATLVVGLDLSALARDVFLKRTEGALTQVEYAVGDFFADSAQVSPGTFDLVWDYTFLCAIPPQWRPRWARRMAELVQPGGHLLSLMFPLVSPEWTREGGPPHPLDPAEVSLLLETEGFVLERSWKPERSHPGRAPFEKLFLFRRAETSA